MPDSFTELVGKVVHHCDILEFFTNNTIRALSKDSILFNEVITQSFSKRVHVLRKLLERSELLTPEHEALCAEMLEIARQRNIVAHNPIASNTPGDVEGMNSYILAVRHRSESFPPERAKLNRPQLGALVSRSNAAVQDFIRLIPGAAQFEPHSP